MTVNPATGLVLWQPGTADLGNHSIDLRVTGERGASFDQTFTLAVTPDTQPPACRSWSTAQLFNPGDTVTVTVSATDNVAVQSRTLVINGVVVALSDNDTATFIATPGLQQITADATDTSGNMGTASTTVRVLDPNNTTAPTVTITSPVTNDTVTYLTQVTGTIDDADLVSYSLAYSLVGANQWTTFATGTQNVTNGVLGTFDPTLLENDSYDIRVTAENVNGLITTRDITFNVSGNGKIGDFTESFTDLTVPLAGIPITITRTYSTLQANQLGDFGYGWSLSLGDPHLFQTVPTTEDGDFAVFPYKVGTKVYITNPSGVREGFTFTPTEQDSVDSPLGPLLPPFGTIYHPAFTPDPGVYDTLTADDIPLQKTPSGEYRYYLFGLPYNPDTFHLTTKDNLTYTYNKFTGLQSVSDLNGNTLTVTANGVTSSTGVSIQFVRDEEGRITQIIDPADHTLNYAYDSAGNLISSADQTNLTTTYQYSDNPLHYLSKVIDPLGHTLVAPSYDAQGRLITLSDGLGNVTANSYDLTRDIERIQDALCNATTIVYDANGNELSRTDALGNTTTNVFDSNHNVIRTTDPLGNTTKYSYDSKGNVTQTIDAIGDATNTTYNSFNEVLTTTDALGRTTTNIYDSNGNLLQTDLPDGTTTKATYDSEGRRLSSTDGDGNVTQYAYGDGSEPIRVINPDGSILEYRYDEFGELISATDELGNVSYLNYDDSGNLISVRDADGGLHSIQISRRSSGK